MKQLNKMRLLCGLPIDPTIEKTEKVEVVTEARKVPLRKSELDPKDEKTLNKGIAGIKSAIKHIEQAVKALDKVPATDFTGDVARYIQELEDMVEDHDGMKAHLEICEANLRKFKREESAKRREEEEEALANVDVSQDAVTEGKHSDMAYQSGYEDAMKGREQQNATDVYGPDSAHYYSGYDAGLKDKKNKVGEVDDGGHFADATGPGRYDADEKDVKESVHFYKDDYEDFEQDDSKPVNVSDGSSNSEQVFDEPMDPKNTKDESPTQLRTGDEKSEQDQSDGHDLEAKVTVPASIKASLKKEINDIKKEAERLDVANKDASYFYNDMAKAFEDLLDHLEGGTRYDMKQAQIYAQSLMGPMLHKLPADVWKFIANGGEPRSLKDYMKPIDKKFPITGPRNSLK